MAGHVLRHVDRLADKNALEILHADGPQIWTYAQLSRAVLGTATGLLNLGLVAGDRVILRLGNNAEFPITYLACIAVGLIPVPLSTQLAPPEVRKISANIQPACTIQSDENTPESGKTLSADKLPALHFLPPADFALGDPIVPPISSTPPAPQAKRALSMHAHRAVWARRMMWDGWYGLR